MRHVRWHARRNVRWHARWHARWIGVAIVAALVSLAPAGGVLASPEQPPVPEGSAARERAATPLPERRTFPTQVDHSWPVAADGGSAELRGIAPRTSFDVVIPPGWAPSADGTLTLHYELPSVVESAVLGVELNGGFVDAIALDPTSGTVSLGLPAAALDVGRNSIEVVATITLIDERECRDPYHPARVVTFGERSRVEIPLVPVGPLLLDSVPASLEPVGVEDRVVTVRLGPEPTDEELTAAADVVAALRDVAELDVALAVTSLDSHARPSGPDILVGVAADLEAAGHEVPAAPGGILSVGRNDSSHTRLVVTGSTPADVLAAARAVGTAPAAPLLVGIEEVGAAEPPAPSRRFTLADLGYPDRDLHGPGLASTVYGFDAPISVAPTSMTVTVDAVRSASADEISGVTVHVNGSRVGTVHFDVDTGATSGVQINVSGADVRPGRNFLRIDAEFHGPPIDCDQLPPEESVEINASTAIELVTNDDTVPIDLEDLPYLLRAPNDSADLVVVLPQDPTLQDYADAVDIAVTYGGDEFPAEVVRAGTLDETTLRGRHVIALGEPGEQPLHELLPDSIVATHADDLAASGAPAVDGSSGLNGVIEVVPNPVDATRVVMLATGFDGAGADLAQRVLLEPDLRGELYGRATFIGGTPDNPLLAPVLEPVRILREQVATDVVDAPAGDETTTSLDDEEGEAVATTLADDGTLRGDAVPDLGSELGSASFGTLGLLLVLGGAGAGAGFLVWRHRRRESVAAVAPS